MITKEKVKEWSIKAGIRAIRTMAQTAIAMIGTSVFLSDIDMIALLSATAAAGILSLLMSIVDLPEYEGSTGKPDK